jgi:hypothetical protein
MLAQYMLLMKPGTSLIPSLAQAFSTRQQHTPAQMQGRQNSMPCILFYSQSLHKQRLKIVVLSKISHPPLLTSIHQNALLLCKIPCLLLSCHKTVKLVITPPSNYPHILSVARLPIHVPFYTERLAFLRQAMLPTTSSRSASAHCKHAVEEDR